MRLRTGDRLEPETGTPSIEGSGGRVPAWFVDGVNAFSRVDREEAWIAAGMLKRV